jgi:hypothetical protein
MLADIRLKFEFGHLRNTERSSGSDHLTRTLVGSGVKCVDVFYVPYDLLRLHNSCFADTLCLQCAPNSAVTDLFCQ